VLDDARGTPPVVTKQTPSAVVFDLGNVLVRWDPFGPYEGFVDLAEVAAFFAEIDFPAFNHAQDAGRSWARARAEVAARLPHRAWLVDHYLSHFPLALPGPVPGTSAVLDGLLAAGVRALGLTNWSAETFHHAIPAAPAIGRLEAVLVSGQEGVAKPDPAIFALLIDRYDLDPSRTAFVDDSAVNVAAAQRAGLRGLLFTDARTLARDLEALGLTGPGGAPLDPA
jgi:2-haloacid dehalogenase